MTDANRVSASFGVEAAYADEATGSTFQKIRMTGESLVQETDTSTSQEIRSDRETADFVRTGIRAAGGLDFEWSYDPTVTKFNKLLQAALLSSAWSTATNVGPLVISAVASTSKFTAVAGTFSAVSVGDVVVVSGLTTAVNNGPFLVTAVAGGGADITVNAALVDETGDADESFVITSYIEAGTTLTTLAIQKTFEDLSPVSYEVHSGLAVDTMSLTLAADAIATGSFGFMGKKSRMTTTSASSGAPTAVSTGRVFNGIDDVSTIRVGGAIASTTSIGLELANNLRTRLKMGALGAISLGMGQIGISGTMQSYFDSLTDMQAYLDFTETSLLWSLGDTNGTYYFNVPRAKFGSGTVLAGGINTDVLADMGWQGYMHASLGYSFRIHKGA